jgi:hypothetical protein
VPQVGVLPSLPAERYAWRGVWMVDAKPTAAVKAVLVRDYGVDVQSLTQLLREVVQNTLLCMARIPSNHDSLAALD